MCRKKIALSSLMIWLATLFYAVPALAGQCTASSAYLVYDNWEQITLPDGTVSTGSSLDHTPVKEGVDIQHKFKLRNKANCDANGFKLKVRSIDPYVPGWVGENDREVSFYIDAYDRGYATANFKAPMGYTGNFRIKFYILDAQRRKLSDLSQGGLYSLIKVTSVPPLQKPSLYAPVSHATNVPTSSQSFDWSSVSNANAYRIIVSENSNFSGFVDDGGNSYCYSSCKTATTTSSRYSGFNLKEDKTYYWKVRAAGANSVSMSDVFSFKTKAKLQPPDLVVYNLSLEDNKTRYKTGERFKIYATVKNQGSGTASSTTLEYKLSTDRYIRTNDTTLDTDSVSGLDANRTGNEYDYVNAPAKTGTYWVGACVRSVSNESNTSNNCSTGIQITVEPKVQPKPDLVVYNLSLRDNKTRYKTGERFRIDATVKNQGSGSAASTTLEYKLSTDRYIRTSDTTLDTDSVSGLDANRTGDENQYVEAPARTGTYWVGACVRSVSNESSTSNNCSTGTQITVEPKVQPKPDLVVSNLSLRDNKTSYKTGERFRIDATVKNQGSGSASSTTLEYKLSTDRYIRTSDTTLDTDSVSGLDANRTGDENKYVEAPARTGTYWVGACVRSVSNESSTSNNCSTGTQITVEPKVQPKPDLVVYNLSLRDNKTRYKTGDRFKIYATIKNQGSGSAGSTTLEYKLSTDRYIRTSDTTLETDYVSSLDANETGNENESVSAPNESRTYWVGACVRNVSNESTTSNNCSTGIQITVERPLQPDLIVSNISIRDNKTEHYEGDGFRIEATVKNQGTGIADSTKLYYKLSTNSTIDTSDRQLEDDTVNSLNAGSTANESGYVYAPNAGTYWVGACVNVVSNESKTSNNCSSSKQIRVTKQPELHPDMVVISVKPNKTEIPKGEYFTVDTTVKNQGKASSASTTAYYKLSSVQTITMTDKTLDTDGMGGLGIGATKSMSESMKAPTSVGSYWIGVCVKPVENEITTNNNCSKSGVFIKVIEPIVVEMLVKPDTPQKFEPKEVGKSSSAKTFTISNTGNADLVIQSITSSNEFKVQGNCVKTIPANGSGSGGGKGGSSGSSSCSFSVVFTPNSEGAKNAVLTISSNIGAKKIQLSGAGIEPINKTPIAAFSVNPKEGELPLRVNLNASSSRDEDGTITNYAWLTTPTAQTASGSHTSLLFNTAGTHNITLTVTDNKGATDTETKTISVKAANKLPVADFTVTPAEGEAPLTVTLDATRSKDEDGTISKYAWSTSTGQTASGRNASLTFSSVGTHTITLTVTDNKGATAKLDKTVSVESKLSLLINGMEKPSAITVSEGADAKTFTVALSRQPSQEITVNVNKLDGSEKDAKISVQPNGFTFDQSNWNVPKTVTVVAEKDDNFENGTATIQIKASGDIQAKEVTVTETDIGRPEVKLEVDQPSFQILEGRSHTFNVRLNSQPTQTISTTVTKLSGEKSDIGIQSGENLVFTSDDWNTYKPVSLKSEMDDNTENGTASFEVKAPDLSPITISVTEVDNGKKKLRLELHEIKPKDIKKGEPFDLVLRFVPDDEKPADGVQVYIEFDPNFLEVNSVTNKGVFDTELPTNTHGIDENGQGYINFAAVSFFNELPTEEVEFVTINFTALKVTDEKGTKLHFDEEKSFVMHQGEMLHNPYADIPIVILPDQQIGKVHYRLPDPLPENPSKLDTWVDASKWAVKTWETNLKIYTQLPNEGVYPPDESQFIKTDKSGQFVVPSDMPLDGSYLCVKGTNTLAHKVAIPLTIGDDKIADFGELWAGEIKQDDKIDYWDLSLVKNVDLNADGSIDKVDLTILMSNYGKPKAADENSLCKKGTNGKTTHYRRGLRDNKFVTLRTTPIPLDLTVGSTFSFDVWVDTDNKQAVDVAVVRLNFDPKLLQINNLETGNYFDVVPENHFDNIQGQIDSVGALWANEASTEPFTLVTVNATLLGEGGEQSIRFSLDESRKTEVGFAGTSILSAQGGEIVFVDDNVVDTNNTVSGYILDVFGNSIANAQIVIGDLEAISDDKGYYELTNVPAGNHAVNVTSEGYKFQTQSVSVNGNVTLDIPAESDAAFECPIYAVQDHRVSDSQIFVINPTTKAVRDLGPLYKKHDIEGLAIDQATGTLYGTSGDKTDKKGHLYRINRETGELTDIGPTGFLEVDSLAIRPNDGTFWGWAVGDGLITIDSGTGQGTLVIPYDKPFFEDMVWSLNGNYIYATEGHNLWVYDGETLDIACDNLPGEVEAVEMLPGNALMFPFYKDNSTYIRVLDIESCEMISEENLNTSYKDIEGMAWWFGCMSQ